MVDPNFLALIELRKSVEEAKLEAAAILRLAFSKIADEARRTLLGDLKMFRGNSDGFSIEGTRGGSSPDVQWKIYRELMQEASIFAIEAKKIGVDILPVEIGMDEYARIVEAQEAGAKLARLEGTSRWIVLDQPEDSELHTRTFAGRLEASEAYLAEHAPAASQRF
jgi:hypothetical protein